jgi:hypothetical protein
MGNTSADTALMVHGQAEIAAGVRHVPAASRVDVAWTVETGTSRA